MKVDLFIKTWSGDLKWLEYCFKSIKKFATNYNSLIVIVPISDQKQFLEMNYSFPKKTKVFYVEESGNGYLFQQYIKMSAHKYSDADYIKYLDSDCVFTRPFDAKSMIYDGKPEILMTSYFNSKGEDIPGGAVNLGGAICWKLPTEIFVGRSVDFEFMRRHIFCYHRSTLENIENWFKQDLKEYIMHQTTFSEFNAIGAYIYIYEQDKYKFVNTEDWTYVEAQVKQFRSWDGIEGSEQELISLLG